MTLRELLKTADLTKTYQYINDKDNGVEGNTHVDIATTVAAYSPVVKELLGKKKTTPFKYKFFVDEVEDWFDKKLYVDVSLLNPRYVKPALGLNPWGGGPGKKVPAGHYNCNSVKHNKRFAFGSTKWSELIDTEVINNTKYSNEAVLGEILWELTFYGWSEKKVKKTWNGISKQIEDVKNYIKNNN